MVEALGAEDVEMGFLRPGRYIDRDAPKRISALGKFGCAAALYFSLGLAAAFQEGRAIILESEKGAKPWERHFLTAISDATSFQIAAEYYMKLDPDAKQEFFHLACGQKPEYAELPGKECVHISQTTVNTQKECAATAAFRGFNRLARGYLWISPDWLDLFTFQLVNTNGKLDCIYKDKLKPLIDSANAGHVLSIFSYSGEGACVDHVDRGLLTLVTNHDGALQVLLRGKWVDVPRTNGLVAFAGKTLELLTHGKYPAVVHRIAPGRGSGRVSLAFKLRSPPETKLVLHGEHDESAAMTTVGDFFDMHVDKPGLSINRPSPSRPRQAERIAAKNGYHAQLACHSQVRSQVIPPDLRVVPLPVLHLCDLKAFMTCRAISREWHGHCNSSELCWVRFCFQRGFPWLQKQVDWPAHFRAWQQRMQNWKSQKKIEAVALPVPFGLITNLRPLTSACQSLRFSAAVEKWSLSGLSEVCFYRPEEGKRTTELECIGIWDGVLLRRCNSRGKQDAEAEFGQHSGTRWDPFVGELNLDDHILVYVRLRGD
ncbi:ACO [Symbiodinium pilosum]|uniref:ACO protein n=1 Tax=Symbiodinium pilosum TaxID=2952 RepID=A0A812IPE9_SYMPI|nr:ACO [Symbiodinium pilosum]